MAEGAAQTYKGKKWLDEEVESLLKRLHLAGAGKRVMTSTHMETISVFEDVVAAMRKEGYHRSALQARSKFKREKADFFSVMQRSSGHPSPGERPPRFHLLKRLWIQGGRPHWAYRFSGTSSRKAKKAGVTMATEDVEILSSEEEDDEENEEDVVVEVSEEEDAEDRDEDQPSTSKAAFAKQPTTPSVAMVEKEVQSVPEELENAGNDEKRPEWLNTLEERFSKLESRMDALEQTTTALVEQSHITRRDVDQLETMKAMHTKAIVTLRQMVNYNRIRTGIRAPKGEEPVLPFIDDDDV